MNNIFFVSQNHRLYQKYLEQFDRSFFNVICIDLSWEDSISHWCTYARGRVSQDFHNANKNYIIGHSVGASVAILLSAEHTFDKVFLYSPSPLFQEFVSVLDDEGLSQLGKEKFDEIKKNISLTEIKDKINSPVFIYIGEKENDEMKNVSLSIHENIKDSSLCILEDRSHHDLIDDHILSL